MTWAGLEDVLLYIEIIVNNSPLTNIKEENDYTILIFMIVI